MNRFTGILLLMVTTVTVMAGGNNEYVKFPATYKDSFTLYNTQNRANNKQVADMYANEIATDSADGGVLADNSVIVMEVYQPEFDQSELPVMNEDGLFKKSKLIAIAVMEKRNDWDAGYPAEERAGNWGFALYTPEGSPKENDLDCVSCHSPLAKQDFMFSITRLMKK